MKRVMPENGPRNEGQETCWWCSGPALGLAYRDAESLQGLPSCGKADCGHRYETNEHVLVSSLDNHVGAMEELLAESDLINAGLVIEVPVSGLDDETSWPELRRDLMLYGPELLAKPRKHERWSEEWNDDWQPDGGELCDPPSGVYELGEARKRYALLRTAAVIDKKHFDAARRDAAKTALNEYR